MEQRNEAPVLVAVAIVERWLSKEKIFFSATKVIKRKMYRAESRERLLSPLALRYNSVSLYCAENNGWDMK